MRILTATYLSLFLVAPSMVFAASDTQDKLNDAGLSAAVAAGCRANFPGDETYDAMFELAFAQFEDAAQAAEPKVNDQDIAKAKVSLLRNEQDNSLFFAEVCELFKDGFEWVQK